MDAEPYLIDLGGGIKPHPKASVVIDTRYPKNSPAQDAAVTPWLGADGPIPDNTADEIHASHVMEHIPRGDQLLAVMNEAWRVLKPGGVFTMIFPVVGYTDPTSGAGRIVSAWMPYADPTHVNLWWLPEALSLYYCLPDVWAAMYGVSAWDPMGPFVPDTDIDWNAKTFWSIRYGWEGIARIRKPVA
jgi:SAM-dependent methyltransferase